MIKLDKTNDIIRVELRKLDKDGLRKELVEVLVSLREEEDEEVAKKDEYLDLLQSDEIQHRKDELYLAVERVRKLKYWKKVLEREIFPEQISEEEVITWQKPKKTNSEKSSPE